LNTTELTNNLLTGLLELEQSGDLVITHPAPLALADLLCSRILQQWANEFLNEPPFEVVIANEIKLSSRHLAATFNIEEAAATSTVEKFVQSFLATRTPKEVAELLTHQGPQEIALGSFYCIQLKRGLYYSSDYIDWRMAHYASQRNR